MIITGVETLRCGAGFRDFCFVKICTDGTTPGPDSKPIVGWCGGAPPAAGLLAAAS